MPNNPPNENLKLSEHPKAQTILKSLLVELSTLVNKTLSSQMSAEQIEVTISLWHRELHDLPVNRLRHVARIASLSRSSARFGQPLTLDEMQFAWWKIKKGMNYQIASGQWEFAHSPYTQPSTPNE
jgi:hypothetical protein